MKGLKFIFKGEITLREDYSNRKDINYYAVLNGYMTTTDSIGSSRVENLAVPIIKETYEELKKQLAGSASEYSNLTLKGDLEVKVRNTCIN